MIVTLQSHLRHNDKILISLVLTKFSMKWQCVYQKIVGDCNTAFMTYAFTLKDKYINSSRPRVPRQVITVNMVKLSFITFIIIHELVAS